jgi:hypothetical protein
MKHNETKEHRLVCKHILKYHPSVFYQSDYFSFLSYKSRLSLGVMRKTGSPDLFIAKRNPYHNGLYIEMKANGTKLFNRNGTLKSTMKPQSEVLLKLRNEGFAALFCVGANDAIFAIEQYLKGCRVC